MKFDARPLKKLTSNAPNNAAQKPDSWNPSSMRRHQPQHRGVDDQQEQPQRDDGQWQRQDHRQRSQQRIDDAQPQRGPEQGGGA